MVAADSFDFDFAMPELPEVETMRRGLFPTIGGKIREVEVPRSSYRPIEILPSLALLRKRTVHRNVVAIDRIAKRLLVRLDSGDSIVMQPKMAGLALIADPPSDAHTRLIFHLVGVDVDRFMYWDRRGLGNVCLWTPSEVDRFLGPDVIGPDASIVDQQTFVDRFCKLNREVKVAMLDQSVISGIGNLYAAEILHRAKVHPQTRCQNISRAAWNRIHESTLFILGEAIEKEGSTLSDGTYRTAINGEGNYQNQHRVYDRADAICRTCERVPVVRIVQGQRSTFFCPTCQPLPPTRTRKPPKATRQRRADS